MAKPPTLSVFIDEAGDPGVRDGLHYVGSRHEWLCLSAVVARSSRDLEAVEWVREMRAAARSTQAGALHYHRVKTERRQAVCQTLATKPVKAFVLASHKTNMREYINPRIGRMLESGVFYNWCIRLLLERVTAWCEQWMREQDMPLEALRIVFAQRGHNYRHFFAYVDKLRMQSATNTLYLKGPGLAAPLLDRTSWLVRPAAQLASLQLADVVASAFYQAANDVSPTHDVIPAQSLGPIIPESKGTAANFGVTVFPLPDQAPLPDHARAIFRYYGYGW